MRAAAGRFKQYRALAVIGAGVAAAFVVVRENRDPIRAFIEHHTFFGIFLYILLNIIDAVVAPGATLPLIPVAARAWGRVPSALLTTIGWTAGSLIAFSIARQWGARVVRRLTSMERIRQMKRDVPKRPFWTVVFFRVVLPMDVLSYVLGLFTDMRWTTYVAATALGVGPAAFVLAYLGRMPRGFDLIAFAIGAAVVIGYIAVTRLRRRATSGAGAATP